MQESTRRLNARETPQRRGKISVLLKYCHGEQERCSGPTMDNSERKLDMFMERCDQYDIPDEERRKEF